MKQVTIKENSIWARIAASVLHTDDVAVVIKRTIYLHGTTCENFMSNKKWLLHELKHVEQYERYGVVRFLLLYMLQSIRYGYYNNKLEEEARQAANDTDLLTAYNIKKGR